MSNLLNKILQIIIKQFNLLWVVLTLICLALAFYISWNLNLNKSYKTISQAANTISNQIDGFTEDLFQEVYTLPVYGSNFTHCKSELLPYLQRIVLNNGNIAGLSIRDHNNRLICSTLSENEALIPSSQSPRSLSGPFNLLLFDQPVFLMQQKMGNYFIGIVIVKTRLQQLLKTSDKNTSSIALYNDFTNESILRVTHKGNGRWGLASNLSEQALFDTSLLYAIDKVQSINNMSVIVFENQNIFIDYFLYKEVLLTLIILCISSGLYFLIKNMMEKSGSLQSSLKVAIRNSEFYPEYQPLYSSKAKTFTGVEVLVRWRDSENQIIMPDFFIGEAEATGLIIPITLQIVKIAFKEMQSILIKQPTFHIAFNLCAVHLTDTHFFTQFYELVKQSSISPQQIILEITERELLDSNNAIFIKTMKRLREQGYSLAVDDYGTGHASINYLQHFPFNYLKIDKLFVQAIGTKAITESLNAAIIQMAKDLNLIIIAEGVETKEQVNYLIENEVLFLQGWYFSKALSIQKLLILLKGEEK